MPAGTTGGRRATLSFLLLTLELAWDWNVICPVEFLVSLMLHAPEVLQASQSSSLQELVVGHNECSRI